MNCPVCLETLENTNICKMPICNHSIHVSCALNAAQYDIRCPLCRMSDPNIIPKDRYENEAIEGLQTFANDAERLVRNWNQRKYRVIQNNPKLRIKRDKMKEARKKWQQFDKETDKLWDNIIQDQWKNNSALQDKKKQLQILRRSYLRKKKQFDDQLFEQAPRPFLFTTY